MTNSTDQLVDRKALRAEIDFSVRHPVMFFFTSSAAWLGVALLLGLYFSVKNVAPDGIGVLPFSDNNGFLNVGKLYGAQIAALTYGWGVQAALGVIIWLTSRLTSKSVKNPGIPLVLGHIWNILLAIGVFAILAGGGSGRPWMELPKGVFPPMMFCYFGIVITQFIQIQVRERKEEFISLWYLMMAMVLFPVIVSIGYIFSFEALASPLMAAAGNAWYRSAFVYLFLIPVAIAVLYYVTAKVSSRPVYSYPIAKAAMWSYIILAPWAGLEKLAGAPIAQFMPNIGATAKMCLLIPFILVAYNIIRTINGSDNKLKTSPSLQFVFASAILFVILGAMNFLLGFPSALYLTQFTTAQHGFDFLALLGGVSFAFFAAMYFIVPRITRREWVSARFIRIHYLFVSYSFFIIVLCLFLGGMMEGQRQGEHMMPWLANVSDSTSAWYIACALAYMCFIFANVFFFLLLLTMWAGLGKISNEATVYEHHHDSDPHGSDSTEADLENA